MEMRQKIWITLKEARSDKDYKIAIELFKEYAALLEVDLSFQNFNEELKTIENQYSRPSGVIFIAYNDKKSPLGCFGIRKSAYKICELKRMYIKKEARGLGIGKQLLTKAIAVGRELEYVKMRLDTLPAMHTALNLYEKTGFYEIEPYRYNPVKGTKYLEIKL